MVTYSHTRDYSAQELETFDKLIGDSIERLPYTLSAPIAQIYRHIEEKNYGRAMNYMLDFFEVSTQYLSCVLFAAIQHKHEKQGTVCTALHRIINKIDTKRPLSFGDWLNDLLTPLVGIAAQELPDLPLLQSIQKHIITKRKNILLGDKKEPSVVQIRNEYKGHSTTLSEEIYLGVVYTLEPRLLLLLQAMQPLGEYYYYAMPDVPSGKLLLLNGAQPKSIEQPTPNVVQSHYILTAQPIEHCTEGDWLDLFPLVFCNESGYVYLFQSLKDEEIAFISSNENAITFISDCWNDALDTFFQKSLPAFDVAKAMNWDEMKSMMATEANRFLSRVYHEKKYNRELFVDQRRLSQFLQEFLQSKQTLFPLLGEAGQGKTNQLCYWTEQMVKEGKGVIIFSCSSFSEITLEEKLKDIFQINRRKPLERLLDDLHQKAVENDETICFFFDAVNECLTYAHAGEGHEGPLELYKEIRRILVHEKYNHFKVLFTCRSYTWKNLLHRYVPTTDTLTFNQGSEEETAVRGFTDEELEEAYHIYRQLYQMDTPFPELKRSVVIRLKDPLVLKMACTNYLDEELPDTMLPFTSLALFDKMFRDINRSYAGNKQCAIIHEMSRILLDQYESGTPADSISIDALHQAYNDEQHELHAMAQMVFKKEGISVAFAELLNKPERPVLRQVESTQGGSRTIQFIYERFLEYALARVLLMRERERLPQPTDIIPAEFFVEELHHGATNVVFVGILRNVLIMDALRTQRFDTILTLASQYSEDYEVMQLLTETLNVLIRENYETETFALIDRLINESIPDGENLIKQFNLIDKKIESNQADDQVIAEHNRLYKQLAPLIRLRTLASVSTLNGIFLTDYFNENLYAEEPFRLLWALMCDPINDVRNEVCLYTYYLSNKSHTTGYTPLRENITERIVKEMYRIIKQTPLLKNVYNSAVRQRTIVFLETATRIIVLLIIDTLLKQGDRQRVQLLLTEIIDIVRYLTGNFRLVKLMMPFFQIVLRKQLTFQSIYVNNVIEYQTFWDEAIIPIHNQGHTEWSRKDFDAVLPYISLYCQRTHQTIEETPQQREQFEKLQTKIMAAYHSGDSFSYFALERILVIVGLTDWQLIRPIITRFFSDEYRHDKWFDYSQMSLLYVLFQLTVNLPECNEEVLELYSRECEDWTRRCRGQYKAHNSHKANPTQHYKRNVMNWYCVVYCRHIGDNQIRPGDTTCVPVFYRLIDEAIANNDKELLYHLIENIAELVTDYGYIHTALALLKYILERFDTPEKVNAIDQISVARNDIYQEPLISLIGRVLSTAKNYFSSEIDSFIKQDLVGLSFPGISKYREEILSYNASGERLSDLFTHRFGNFLMWSLLHEESVDDFALEAMSAASQSKDCFQWFDQVVRILFKHLFKVKL